MDYHVYDFKGVKQALSPFLHSDGDLLECQNLVSYPVGAKTKRTGYTAFLGTVENRILSLWSWEKPSTGELFLYAGAGQKLYVTPYASGTGTWSIAGNGTASSSSAYWGHASLDDTLIVGDGVGSTRHTTNGTSFTNTTLAPVSNLFAEYNQRIYAGGTSSYLYASELGSASGWNPSASTNPSFSEPIGGGGNILSVKNINGEVVITKDGGEITHFNYYNKYQNPSRKGPTSERSMDEYNGIWFYLNTEGINAFDTRPKLVSKPIQDLVYNNDNEGIGDFVTSAGGVVYDDYLLSVNKTRASINVDEINNAVLKYNIPLNQWSYNSYGHRPRSFAKFVYNTKPVYIFGDELGQCYQFSKSSYSDAGTPITASMLGFLTFGAANKDKLVRDIVAFASPGCGAKLQIAMSNTFDRNALNWVDIGSLYRGELYYKSSSPLRGKFLFYRLYERSTDKPFTFYGFTFNIDPIGR